MRYLLCCLVALAFGSSSALAATASDPYVARSYSVLAPGSISSFPAGPHSTDQLALYDGLTPLGGDVSESSIERYFKPSEFGSSAMSGTVEKTGHKGLKIVQDEYGVPHVFGQRRDDVMFGAGWATAHDRGLLINALRQAGRLAALNVPNFNPKDIATVQGRLESSPEAEARLDRQLSLLRTRPDGPRVDSDLKAYVAGINSYFRQHHTDQALWTERDVIACSAMVDALFGANGGGEVADSALLDALQGRLGSKAGHAVWADLTRPQDPEVTTTIAGYFPYGTVPKGLTSGSVVVDADSFDRAEAVSARAAIGRTRHSMSNALVVSGSRSTTGHPLAVMGPQAGYVYPPVVMELDLHGGGIDARGIAFAGAGPYVALGRGRDFAWSATTNEGDTTDQFLEQLCKPGGGTPKRSSRHYRYLGRCIAMRHFVVGSLKADGRTRPVGYWETVHGPVGGTLTVKGRPFAVATKRSTTGREVLNGIAFMRLNENRVRSPHEFVKTMLAHSEMTLNWFYIDANEIAFASAGRFPRRARDVHPNLPTLGDGRHEWRGFLTTAEHPNAIDPKSGALLNWNNAPARGFGSSDAKWEYQPVHRVDLINHIKTKNSLSDLVGVMNGAATKDLRAVSVWPTLRRVLGGSSNAPNARAAAAAVAIDEWSASGGSRLDADLDGKIDAPGAAVLDGAWPAIGDAVLGPVLGRELARFKKIMVPDNVPSSAGSAFEFGWYGYIAKDLRHVLGDRVRAPYSRVYCGDGKFARCRTSLWSAISQAADKLAVAQGDDVAAWHSSAEGERVKFLPGLISDTMRWVNRPTFQQVIEFKSHRQNTGVGG